jgi:hypothetical protein
MDSEGVVFLGSVRLLVVLFKLTTCDEICCSLKLLECGMKFAIGCDLRVDEQLFQCIYSYI